MKRKRHAKSINFKKFAKNLSIPLALWTSAFNWDVLNKKGVKEDKGNEWQAYFTSASTLIPNKSELKMTKFTTHLKKCTYLNWESFDSSEAISNSIGTITLNPKSLDECSSRVF